MDDNEDLKAIYAAARSIQSAATQAVAELAQLVADILWIKESPAPRKDTPQAGADAHSHASHGSKSKGSQETQSPAVDNQEREQP